MKSSPDSATQKNLPLTPPQCYEQVCKEWTEFQPQSTQLLKQKQYD
ncbi:hypothetical protein RintRC_1238 [Richelia intracellularis]|nr:hypothetical protein RintRC_1238 [Richelia intracellularis]